MNAKPQKTWRVRTFYRKAWDLTLKHKKLWIIGLAIAATSGGGSSGGGGGGDGYPSPSPTTNTIQEQSVSPNLDPDFSDPNSSTPTTIPDKEPTDALSSFFQQFLSGFASVPIYLYAILILEFIFLIIFFVTLGLITRAWAVGTMVSGVDQAVSTDQVSLTKASRHALTRVKPIIWISIVPWIAFFLALIAIVVATLVTGFIIKPNGLVIALLILTSSIILTAIFITIATSQLWAARYAVLQNLPGSKAFNLGRKTIKGNLWKMIRLGIANSLFSGITTLVILIPIGGIGFATLYPAIKNQQFTFFTLIPIFFLAFFAVPLFILKGAIVNVFKFATWHYGYQVVKKQSQ